MYRLGVLLEEDDPAEAERWYMRAAEVGSIGAAVKLAYLGDERPGTSRG
jgi:TPR repeat protein